jgi:hypothetical protein
MDVPLAIAGVLGVIAAAVHGAGGELLVVRKLAVEALPPSRFGGPRTTKAMIHVTWHVTTIAFLTGGCALLVAATVLSGDAARALGVVSAAAFTGYAAIAVAVGAAYMRSPRSLLGHPGPPVLAVTAALAWLGAI